MIVEPDSEGIVREGLRDKAVAVWGTATRLHCTVEYRLTSQPLSACVTPNACIGGASWPNFITRSEWERPIALWANSTLGMMNFWWIGSRQQPGRPRISISRLPELLSLDCRALTDEQIDQANAMFDEFAERDLLPANEAYRDPVRQELDASILCDLLGLPESIWEPLATLRLAWCSESTVHSGKSTRP